MQPHEQLEKEYAEFVGSKYAISVSSGTAALHLALVVLGVTNEDEVIVPDFTMAACGFAVAYTGAKAVTVDCDQSMNIDIGQIEEKITKKTKVIMPVHIYGRLCRMEELYELLKTYDIKVVEDACEAQGAVFNSKADLTCYSLYKNKIINSEEGGMITTNNKYYAEELKRLKNMYFDDEHTYFHKAVGYNYRLSDAHAKIALESLRNYKQNIQKRAEIAKKYEEAGIRGQKHDALWVYDCIHPKAIEIVQLLNKNGIQARYVFKPLSSMPPFKQEVGKMAKYFSENAFYLPLNPELSYEKIQKTIDLLQPFYAIL